MIVLITKIVWDDYLPIVLLRALHFISFNLSNAIFKNFYIRSYYNCFTNEEKGLDI